MKGFKVFLRGNGLKNVKAALYAWFFNLLFSLFIYFAYYKLFANAAGKTTIAADVSGEIGVFTFLTDISRNYDGNFSLVFSLALMTALLFVVVSIFLAGGIYAVLVEDDRVTFSNLLSSSIENFLNMLKLFFVNLPNCLVALFIPGIMLFLFLKTKSLVLNETLWQIFIYLWVGITALVFTFSVAIYDFSRVFKLKEDRNVFLSFKKGITFTFSNKLNILAIFLLYGLSLVFLYLIYSLFVRFVPDFLYTLFIFIIYQVFVMVRYYLKIVVMRAEVGLAGVELAEMNP